MQIGIVGAGIGGLAAAALLAQAGHQVALAERFATPQPVGSGLVVQPVGLAVLDALGAGDAAREQGAPHRVMQGRQDGRRAADRLPAGRRPPRAAVVWSLSRAALADWSGTDVEAWRAGAKAFWPEMAPFLATITSPAQMTPAAYSHGGLLLPMAGMAWPAAAAPAKMAGKQEIRP